MSNISLQNVISILDIYRARGVHAVRTPSGVVFMGASLLKPAEKSVLLDIPQKQPDKALRWQK